MGNFALSSYGRVTACRTRTERVGLVIMGRSELTRTELEMERWSSDYGEGCMQPYMARNESWSGGLGMIRAVQS